MPPSSHPSVYITRMIPESGVASLARAGMAVRMFPLARNPEPADLLAEASHHDGFITQVGDRIDRPFLKRAAPRCKIVANCAVGTDNIDLKAAAELGVVVTNTPDVLTEATADLTLALLLAAARRLGEAERVVRAGAWRGWGMLDFLGADVHGRTLGIVGAGRIGTAVARRARGFDMALLYCGRNRHAKIEQLGARRVLLYELLENSDFVSLHAPLTPETRHMIDAKAFSHFKAGAILINASRGSLVDQVEMIEALRNGRLAAAGLDVYEKEPAVPSELLAMENVVLLPHIGSATVSARDRMAEMAAANILAVLGGKGPVNPVS
ncbi:MAG TPA: D-glycerate dehydrogenase [Phycisphaerae bacterium]|nr:D-glycerate dehydrogenase [Phycisphaerae bacterium]